MWNYFNNNYEMWVSTISIYNNYFETQKLCKSFTADEEKANLFSMMFNNFKSLCSIVHDNKNNIQILSDLLFSILYAQWKLGAIDTECAIMYLKMYVNTVPIKYRVISICTILTKHGFQKDIFDSSFKLFSTFPIAVPNESLKLSTFEIYVDDSTLWFSKIAGELLIKRDYSTFGCVIKTTEGIVDLLKYFGKNINTCPQEFVNLAEYSHFFAKYDANPKVTLVHNIIIDVLEHSNTSTMYQLVAAMNNKHYSNYTTLMLESLIILQTGFKRQKNDNDENIASKWYNSISINHRSDVDKSVQYYFQALCNQTK